ncbi:MAG TPA: flagellin, partial [Synergistaceae bacterium]|nr:flagellin [Synergistaceae bacterium]
LEAENGSVTVRIQGHIVDREGNYRYAEEERITLGSTNEDMFFLGSPYLQGLHFHHFDFTDISRLRQGDRFTLSLVADGRDEYDPVEDQYAVDEIDLFGGDTNPGIYPISWRFFDGVLDNKTTVLHTYQVTPKVLSFGSEAFQGKVHDGELSLSFGDFHGGTPLGDGSDTTPRTVRDTAIFSSVYREGIDGGVAHRYSSLRDIAQFWDKNGKFLLDDPVTITIRRGDKESPFTLYGNEEIHALLERLNAALYDELGEGELSYLMPSSSKEKFVTFTGPLAGKNMIESVEGTLILRSAFAGEKGSYEFRGDEQILQALGLTVIQEARDTTYSISVTDAHSGKGVASGLKVAGGDDLRGIWGDAVRLRFDALLGISGVQYNEQTGRFVLGSASEVYRTVHLADNATMLQIGANEKEDMLLSLGAVDAETLGVHNISVGDSEHAGRSITVIDAAIDRVSRHRAQYGALVNRLGHATSALTVTSENLSAAESRIRDLDFAKEMMEFTKLNILTQVGTSMLTQANQLPKNVLSLLQ